MFELTNFFVTRIPSYPINMFFELINDNDSEADEIETINKLCSSQCDFGEKILVSSMDLYNTLTSFVNGKQIRNPEYFFNSIYKFLIRSCTRATPFGLFAGVSFGSYSDATNKFELTSPNYIKHSKPNMLWQMKLSKKIEQDSPRLLSYKVNESVVVRNDRAVLINSTNKQNEKGVDEVSVSYTDALKLIFELAQDYISFSDLLKAVTNKFNDTASEIIDDYIIKLIENEYLISDLRIPITNCDTLECFINKIRSLDLEHGFKNSLEEIYFCIKTYDKTNDVQNYIELYEKMNSICECKNVLKIDTTYSFNQLNINKSFIDELNDLLRVIFTFSPNKSYSIEQSYKDKFIERYGTDKPVNILELLDSLGSPDYDKQIQAQNPNNLFAYDIVEYVNKKYCEAMRNNSSVIEITDEDILSLSKFKTEFVPDSLELNMLVLKSNDKFVYELGAVGGATKSGKSSGRFRYLLHETNEFKNITEDKQNTSEHEISCELCFTSKHHELLNVMQNYNTSDYEIALSIGNSKDINHQIKLDDIFIGISNNKFYAYSKSLSKVLNITINNMLEMNSLPNVFRFLLSISTDNELNWYSGACNMLFADYVYVPQIRYKNFIIQPEYWILNKNILGISEKDKFNDFEIKLTEFINMFKVNQYVYCGFADNKLLMNLTNKRCRKILFNEVMNKKSDIILCTYDKNLKPVTNYNNKSYITEIFVPLKRKKHLQEINDIPNYPFYSDISELSPLRLKQPFDEWLYFKLYLKDDFADEFIQNDMANFMQEMISQNEIQKYFFIRYVDSRKHLRLRINANQEDLLKVYPKMKKWLSELIERGCMSDFVIDCYSREIERYGGIDLINYAEDIFYVDSVITSQIINFKSEMTNEILAVICILKYMQQFQFDISEFDFPNDNKLYRDAFQKDRVLYQQTIINQLNDDIKDERHKALINILELRHDAVCNFITQLQNRYGNEKIDMQHEISNSFIHMHMNRLFGTDTDFEKKAMMITYHALRSVKRMNEKYPVLTKVNC